MTDPAPTPAEASTRRPKRRRVLLGLAILGTLGGSIGFWLGKDHILLEVSEMTRGRRVAERAACFSCHGRREIDIAFNPRRGRELADAAPSDEHVPAIVEGKYPLAIPNSNLEITDVRDWITQGTIGMRDAEERAKRQPRLLDMPGYADHLSPDEIADLVTFVGLLRYHHRAHHLADDGFGTTSPGERLARRYGCFHCHGELGQGGVENPGSLKGYIPGFFGTDFDLLTQDGDRQAIREWIRDGASKVFIEQSFLGFEPARYFTERAVVAMPAYGDLLSDDEIDTLVEYCLELRGLGSFATATLLEYQTRYAATFKPTPQEPEKPAVPAGFFVDEVKPILEAHCVECHGPDKQDNDYRMDQKELAMAGGDISEDFDRKPFVPGDAAASLAIVFVRAENVDEDAEIYPMPPRKKREPLSPAQVEVLVRWVETGVAWPEGVTLEEKDKR